MTATAAICTKPAAEPIAGELSRGVGYPLDIQKIGPMTPKKVILFSVLEYPNLYAVIYKAGATYRSFPYNRVTV